MPSILEMHGIGKRFPGVVALEDVQLQVSTGEIVALAANLRITPQWDQSSHSPHFSYTAAKGVYHEVWYVNQRSLSERATVANSLKMKLGVWRLGREDQTIWQLPLFGGEGQ